MDVAGLILGIGISIGSVATYIPQFYNIIKNESVEGISESSLILLNIAMMCLTMNSLIYSWDYFFCCFLQLFPFLTIFLSWLIVLVYYIIFLIYKFKNLEKIVISTLSYAITYLFFIALVISLALGEKFVNHLNFFIVYANILGIASAVGNGLVYIPQIYMLIKAQKIGNLSLLMYVLQTPGNIIIIIFHAIIYEAPITTWITYVVIFVEQTIILVLMIIFIKREREKKIQMVEIDNPLYD